MSSRTVPSLIVPQSIVCVLACSICLLVTTPCGQTQDKKSKHGGTAANSATSQPTPPAVPNAQLAAPALNSRVEELLGKMTLEEKVGQLAQYSVGAATGPGATRDHYDEEIQQGAVGSLLNVVGAEDANRYQHIAIEKTRLHIPLIFGYDVIHGDHTTFPIPLGLAASFDPQAVELVARTSAVEARADGIQWVFSPMVDISRDARWGRIAESAGEDPFLGSAVARAWVHGYQQDDLSNPQSVAVSVKHYAAYGAPVAGRDYNAVDMSELTLRQVYLPPYHAAVEAGAATLMSSFNSLNGVPSSANPLLLNQILRREWGFQGFVVSDWGAVRELMSHSIAPDGATAARKAVTAGVDMDMESDLYRTRLATLVRNGQVPESVVTEAARRVLRVKFALGLFEHPYAATSAPYTATPEKRALARKVADETLVLLKNDPVEGVGKLLPIRKAPRSIALIGPLADSKVDMLGSWSSSGNAADAITLKSALEARTGAAKTRLIYAKGTEILTDTANGFDEAVAAARQADIVVMALGESGPGMTGEAASRANIGLPGNQQQLLEAVAATGKPIILVVFSGRPLALPWAAKHIPAILEAWFPGIEAGNALTDVLYGDANPSGKLPVSFPYSVGQEPLYYAQLPTGRPAHGDLTRPPASSIERFMSRYLDEPNDALFPFGWGLSYTQFTYSQPRLSLDQVSAAAANADRRSQAGLLTVSFDVKNTGAVAGSDVAQLYIRNTSASVEQPVRQLKGFQRITLAPGEVKHLEFKLGFEELSFYNVDLQRVIEPTKYDIWVGESSLATEKTQLVITE